jgi:DNA primase
MNSYHEEKNYYKKALLHETIGAPARNYLKKRGINKSAVDFWEIGYCPVGNQKYKKLQGRITFPVYDQSGKITTISGRKIFDNMNGPKYDMYPFPARKILFGLWQNKENIRDLNRAIITEGQLDVISAWQQGLKIATSSFGAHGSLDHLANISRYAKRVDVLYDADEAGIKGINGIKSLSTLGDLEIIFKNPFSNGEDLDSWINKNSADKLFNYLDRTDLDILKRKINNMERKW